MCFVSETGPADRPKIKPRRFDVLTCKRVVLLSKALEQGLEPDLGTLALEQNLVMLCPTYLPRHRTCQKGADRAIIENRHLIIIQGPSQLLKGQWMDLSE